ncbi:MAG: OadG family protein [Paraprevotella sp.]|nr:OadG family protein [Paraprevotella sp.]
MENIGIALQLMVVGMATVFIILMIVIQLGKLLIGIVNKVAPEEAQAPARQTKAAAPTAVDAQTMAVIQAVVGQITGGKGAVKNVERV